MTSKKPLMTSSISPFSEEMFNHSWPLSPCPLSPSLPRKADTKLSKTPMWRRRGSWSVSFPNPVHPCWCKLTRNVDSGQGFPGACNGEIQVQSLGKQDSLKRQWQTHSSDILARKFTGRVSLAGYSPWGCKE